MRLSKLYMPTLREAPADAELQSHKLLLRAGMIRRTASGVYSYLPLGYRTIKKVEDIIRQEMDRAGAQETMLPIIQPRELWDQSGRWQTFGPEMFRLKDRGGRDMCLGPTHEEVMTDLVRDEVNSFRQLPFNLYQIQAKFRDEVRPRFGLMRAKEFIMKDAYSFDRDPKGMEESYYQMKDAYKNIFDRLGLTYKVVYGDSGAIGGDSSQEFMAISDVGEDIVIYSDSSDYAANLEKAEVILDVDESGEEKELELKETPGIMTIEDLEEFLDVSADKTGKMVIYETEEGKAIIGLVPGHRELNEVKLFNAAGVQPFEVEVASDETIFEITGASAGYSGPIDLKGDYELYIDERITKMKNIVIGANKEDSHYINANYGRDFDGVVVDDILEVEEGDRDPYSDEGKLLVQRGIEVGHIFQLGTGYAEDLGLYFHDENQKDQPVWMGCYGIGVGRSMAAVVEQMNDENGIIWPISIAPFEVIITMINNNNEDQVKLAEKLYKELTDAGYEVLLDDRKERPGVKFADRDLIGIPLRITVGRDAADGIVEYSTRAEMENTNISADDVKSNIEEYIKNAKDQGIF